MKKNILFILLFITFFSAFSVCAQDSSSLAKRRKVTVTRMLTFSPGYAFVDVSGLGRFTDPSTPGNFSEHFGVLAIQSTSEYCRFISGLTIQMGISPKSTIRDYAGVTGQNIEYYGTFGNIMMHGGYSIVSTERVKFYPLLGAGFGKISANFARVDNRTTAQFASNPNVQGDVSKYMVCLDGALSLDLLLPSRNSENNSYGKILGLRIGYTQGLGVGTWRFEGARILENPDYNPGMVYARLLLGGFGKKTESCTR